jgi:hypothetical protein
MLLAAFAASPASAQPRRAQPLAAGTSAVRGSLTDALTKSPIENCAVRLALTISSPTSPIHESTVTTGPDGVFEFAEIADGRYALRLQCPSHLSACVKAGDVTSAPCESLTLLKDQQRSNIHFRLTPGATIRGFVVDEAGAPVRNATVRLGMPIGDAEFQPTVPATTKADGSFELVNVAPGRWRLEVELPPKADALRMPVVYLGGVLSPERAGSVVTVAGKVIEKIRITIPRVLDNAITVRLPRPDTTLTEMSVMVIRPEPLLTRRLEVDNEGQAVLRGLTPGRYFLTATALSAGERWAAFEPVDFIEGALELAMQLQPAGRIRGRIVGDRGMPSLDGATVGALWMDNDVPLNPLGPDEAPVAADGSFEIGGVFGHRRLQLGRFDPGWRIHSVLQGKSDVTTAGVDVTPGFTTEVIITVRPR